MDSFRFASFFPWRDFACGPFLTISDATWLWVRGRGRDRVRDRVGVRVRVRVGVGVRVGVRIRVRVSRCLAAADVPQSSPR